MTSLADEIRSQAAISARPGQCAELDAIADRVAALEAAQRPPLGYTVVTTFDEAALPSECSEVMHPSAELAREAIESAGTPYRCSYVVAEVREVQP